MSLWNATPRISERSKVPPKAFIESYRFPWSIVSESSAIEKGPGRPSHWEMIFWWTRKPLISARAIIAGCLLSENTNPKALLANIGISSKSKAAHRNQPFYRFGDIKLLDPFAGFGSIPLEAARLGLKATAVELLPVAYVFLKAVLEYPAKYGRKLVEDVEKWGRWITEELRKNPLIKELYDEDTAVYVGTWEIKCPECGCWTPVVGNWWLARTRGRGGFKRLAWMEYEIKDGKVEIKVIDLNKILGDQNVREAKVSRNIVEVGSNKYRVPDSNIDARRGKVVCLCCRQPIMRIDTTTRKHYIKVENLPREIRNRLESYLKYAIKTYNQSLENEYITPIARQRLLVKVRIANGNQEFESCAEKDQEKLEKALREVKRILKEEDPDLSNEEVPPYDVREISIITYGFDKWYKLFNPRQLLLLIILTKLIREVGKKVEEEKRKDKLTREEAYRYAEAVTTYLSIALLRLANYNSVITLLHPSNPFGVEIAHTLSMRGLSMQWNWGDTNPLASSRGGLRLNSWLKCLEKVINGLYSLVSMRYDPANINIFMDDATTLSKVDANVKFDLVVTDPPYYDDVAYTELSDFYYVWLKKALSDVENGRLVPRFLPEAFFERIGDSWIEVPVQWKKFALNEVSLNPPRLGIDATRDDGIKHFQNLLNVSFIIMARRLVDDGLLVTYYAHTNPEAWKALLKAGWESAGLRITNVFPIITESAQSVVKRGKLSMDTSIVVVWRKGVSGSIELRKLREEMIEAATERALKLIELGITRNDLFINTLAAALATATRYKEIVSFGKLGADDLLKEISRAAVAGLVKAFTKRAELKDEVKTFDAIFYLLVKRLMAGARRKILESTDISLLSIGTLLDEDALKLLEDWKILALKNEREGGAKVAKAKTLILLEPPSIEKSKISEFLEVRGIGVSNEPNIRCAVDVLHVLEYYAIKYPVVEYMKNLEVLREKYPSLVNEALSLAKILARILPESDPEKYLCERVISPALQIRGS